MPRVLAAVLKSGVCGLFERGGGDWGRYSGVRSEGLAHLAVLADCGVFCGDMILALWPS